MAPGRGGGLCGSSGLRGSGVHVAIVREVAGWFAQVAIGLDPSLSVIGPVRAAVEQSLPLVLSVAALVVLGPLVVLYFALSGEGRE